MKDALERLKRRYGLKIPTSVIMADYDADEGDLYIKFSETEHTEGEPTSDGLVIVHHDSSDAIAAIEILNLAEL